MPQNVCFKPKISIVTVTFNSGKTLEKSIQSVLSQTYPNKELIIIDGASTDSTLEIIKKYEAHIAFSLSEKDQGIYDAMNKGWRHASGDFVHFLNSDDWFCNSRSLESMIERMNHHSDMSTETKLRTIWFGRILYEEYNGDLIPMGYPYKAEDLRFELKGIHQPGMLTPRKLFDEVGGFDIRYRIAADYDFIRRAVMAASAQFEPVDMVQLNWGGVSQNQAYRALKENIEIAKRFGESSIAIYKHVGPQLLKAKVRKDFPGIVRLWRLFKRRDNEFN